MPDYNHLLKYASEDEQVKLKAVIEEKSLRKAASRLSKAGIEVNHQRLSRLIDGLSRKAAVKGDSPEHHLNNPVPDGFIMDGFSMYHPKTEAAPAYWVKAKLDRIKYQEAIKSAVSSFISKAKLDRIKYQEAIKSAVSSFISDVQYVKHVESPSGDLEGDVIPWVQIGDAHLGMLCHAYESMNDFNIKIAEADLCCAIDELIKLIPKCQRLVINDLGDFTNHENIKGETEASGHRLSVDMTFDVMISSYSRIMRYIIERCLSKAMVVDVIVNQGNHSRTNDIWMAELLRAAYGHTGRVNVLNNGRVFIAYRMGNTLVMTHHSDKCPPKRLANVMTSDYREDFGQTQNHYIYIGHIHHGMVLKEHPSITIESFNNLAVNNKWDFEAGYRAKRSISIVNLSKQYGEVGRHVLPLAKIRDALGLKLENQSNIFRVQ